MFSKWLSDKLEEKEWKQADLAKRSGMTAGAISNYVNGRTPDKIALSKIAKAFKIPPETIFQIAGILPEEVMLDEVTKEATYIFQRLNEEEKENAIRHLRLTLKIQEERKKKKQ
jgi:transcriptional regulator with XRE-family HTH domain